MGKFAYFCRAKDKENYLKALIIIILLGLLGP